MNSTDIILKIGLGAVICIVLLKLAHTVSAFLNKRMGSKRGQGSTMTIHGESKSERRGYSRVDIVFPVKMDTSHGPVKVEIRNITLGGAFICCPEPLPLGESFALTIDLPDHDPLNLMAEVVWSNINVPDEKIVNRGMGIRFIRITETERKLLTTVLSGSMEKEPG